MATHLPVANPTAHSGRAQKLIDQALAIMKEAGITFVEYEGGAPLATQLDGEEWPADHRVQIQVVKQGIRLIVPEPEAA